MRRLMMAALVVVMLAAMAVPAFGAEKAAVQARTQTSAGPVEGDGAQIQAQIQTQAQVRAQTYAGEECGDCSQTQTQTQTQTQAQTQTQTQTTQSGDEAISPTVLRLQEQDRLRDSACDTSDAAPDQVRERAGVEDPGAEQPDDEPDGWLAAFLFRLKNAFSFMLGRV